MVKNEDVKQEFDLFGDIWKMFKSLLPVGAPDDDKYWDNALKQVNAIRHRHPGAFGDALALAVLDELDRRCRKGEVINRSDL